MKVLLPHAKGDRMGFQHQARLTMNSHRKVGLRKAEAYLLILPWLQRYTLKPTQAAMRQDCRHTHSSWCLEFLLPTEVLPQLKTRADEQQDHLIGLHGSCTKQIHCLLGAGEVLPASAGEHLMALHLAKTNQ